MKYIITESQTESLRKLFLGLIKTKGFIIATKTAGGVNRLFQIIGGKSLTKDFKLKVIKEIVSFYRDRNRNTYFGLNWDDVIIKDTNEEIHRLELLHPDYVLVYIFKKPVEGDGWNTDEYELPYNKLKSSTINEIFDITIRDFVEDKHIKY
jgi:hypothetical protein